MVPCSSDTLLYFVFEALPMGWSWSSYFAQAAVSQAVERALTQGPMPFGHDGVRGGLIEDGRATPYIGPSFATCAAYVDNATVLAASPADCAEALRLIREELGRVGLIVGDADAPSYSVVTFDMKQRRVSLKADKVWAVYRACVTSITSVAAPQERWSSSSGA